MKLPRRKFLHLAAGTAVLIVLVALADHAAWPQGARTVRVIVPFPAGGPTDTLARLLGEQVTRAGGPSVVVENRPGGAASIAYESVTRAPADGNTGLMVANSFVINPQLRKTNYDPLTSYEPVCWLVRSPNVVSVNNGSPYRTLADLLGAARAKPGELTLAAPGPATTQHIAFEVLKRAANVNITFVPYAGSAPAVTGLLGGHVTSSMTDYQAVTEQVKTGNLRALAVASRERLVGLADVPTVAESGFKDYEHDVWYGLVVPAKTPQQTVSQLSGWFTAALEAVEVKSKLASQGLYPTGLCGNDFAVHLRRQFDEYGRVIREANIKAE